MTVPLYGKDHICNRAVADIIEIQKPLSRFNGLHLLMYGRYYETDNTGFLFYTNKPFFTIRSALNVPFPATYTEQAIHPWHEIHSESFMKIAEDFNIFTPINIIQKIDNGIEAFTYAFSSKENPGLTFYFSHLDLLKKFGEYFKLQAEDIINEAENNKIEVPAHLTSPTKEAPNSYEEDVKYIMMNITIPEDISDEHKHLKELTKKEFVCLCYYLMGKTAAEIAVSLKLSPKTVSAHIYNVRTKLKCKNRSELFQKAWDMGLISSTVIDLSELDD